MMNFLRDFEKSLGIKITCSQETEPMGTAGPLALAREKLDDGSGESFFVLNSDVISEYPLRQMVEFHKKHGGEATIMVTKVRAWICIRDHSVQMSSLWNSQTFYQISDLDRVVFSMQW
jgi:NDP-sugar pyrophosphorylase family protein